MFASTFDYKRCRLGFLGSAMYREIVSRHVCLRIQCHLSELSLTVQLLLLLACTDRSVESDHVCVHLQCDYRTCCSGILENPMHLEIVSDHVCLRIQCHLSELSLTVSKPSSSTSGACCSHAKCRKLPASWAATARRGKTDSKQSQELAGD
jgi:hypothetical protein